MTTKETEEAQPIAVLTIRNLNVSDVMKVSKIGKSTQQFKDSKTGNVLTSELLLLKGSVGKKNIVLKLYGTSTGTNVEGEPVQKKPTVSYTEVEQYIEENKLDLPVSVDMTLTVIEDGKGDNTYKHFDELASHIDLNEAFGE